MTAGAGRPGGAVGPGEPARPAEPAPATRFTTWAPAGVPEVRPGDDLAGLLAAAEPGLRDGDVVVVTSKVVSKAEGRLLAGDRSAAVAAETVRLVAARGDTRIVQTRHGFVVAAAGVDASNLPLGVVALLPVDPDASAGRIRAGLRHRLGVDVGVVVSDTFGRPWRVGLTDVAVGVAGLPALLDLRGRVDRHGGTLQSTVTALADELAAAADLVKGKLAGAPFAVLRGLQLPTGGPDARALVRPAAEDLFRSGSTEAGRAALRAPRPARLGTGPVPAEPVRRAVRAAAAAAAGLHRPPPLLAVRRTAAVRRAVLEAAGGDLPAAPVLVLVCRPAGAGDGPAAAAGAAAGVLRLAAAVEGLASAVRWLPGRNRASVGRAATAPTGWPPVAVVAVGRPVGPAG